jgi:hypothetical protein
MFGVAIPPWQPTKLVEVDRLVLVEVCVFVEVVQYGLVLVLEEVPSEYVVVLVASDEDVRVVVAVADEVEVVP